MEKVHILSLGCPKNLADSELMLGALAGAGFEITLDPDEAQVLVVNTCAFIEAAKKESIDAILEAGRVKQAVAQDAAWWSRDAWRSVTATSCASSCRRSISSSGRATFSTFRTCCGERRRAESRPVPYTGAAHLLPSAAAPRVKTGDFFSAYLKISEGCDHKCAFCIIPKIRGRHESRVARTTWWPRRARWWRAAYANSTLSRRT